MFAAFVGRGSFPRRTRLTPSERYAAKAEIEKLHIYILFDNKRLCRRKLFYAHAEKADNCISPKLTPLQWVVSTHKKTPANFRVGRC